MRSDVEDKDLEVSRLIKEREKELVDFALGESPHKLTKTKLIKGHCSGCGKVLFHMYGDWETWMTSTPIFCLECYKDNSRLLR